VLGLTVAVMAVVTACSGGAPHPVVVPTTAPPSSLRSTTTTAAPAAPTTTVALIPQETPDLAATALLTAWRAGDRHGALLVAIPSAVDALFAQGPQSFSDRGCQSPLNGMASCAFGIGGNAAIAQIQTVTLAGGWVVQTVAVNPNS
jgi:hypothetical protein